MRYYKLSEMEVRALTKTRNTEDAVSQMLDKGFTLVSVTYIGDVRGYGPSGWHVYHFVK